MSYFSPSQFFHPKAPEPIVNIPKADQNKTLPSRKKDFVGDWLAELPGRLSGTSGLRNWIGR